MDDLNLYSPYISPEVACSRLGWTYTEWFAFVLAPYRRLRPDRTEAGRGLPLRMPCGIVIRPTKPSLQFLVYDYGTVVVDERSLNAAREWDAQRRLTGHAGYGDIVRSMDDIEGVVELPEDLEKAPDVAALLPGDGIVGKPQR